MNSYVHIMQVGFVFYVLHLLDYFVICLSDDQHTGTANAAI